MSIHQAQSMNRFLTAVLTCLVLASCGGGGGSDAASETPAPTDPAPVDPAPVDPPPAGAEPPAFNAGLSGYIVYDRADGTSVVDLASGQIVASSATLGLRPVAGGDEFVAYDSVRRYSDGEDDLITFDATLEATDSVAVARSLHGTPKVSPDGSLIAMYWSDEENGESFTRPSMTIFDREGAVLERNPSATSFAWAPDGRLVFAEGDTVYIGNELGQQGRVIAELDGDPYNLAVSPDGSKIAFNLSGLASEEAHIWVMNIDGSGLRQLTDSSTNEMDPQWIGDGSWLLARQGVSDDIQGANGCPRLYAVPTDESETIELEDSEDTPAELIRYYDSDDAATAFEVCPFSSVAWVAAD